MVGGRPGPEHLNSKPLSNRSECRVLESFFCWRMEPPKSISVYIFFYVETQWYADMMAIDGHPCGRLLLLSKIQGDFDHKTIRRIWDVSGQAEVMHYHANWGCNLPVLRRFIIYVTLTWLDVNLVDLANIDLSPLSCIISSAHLRRLIIGNRHLSFDAASLVHICHIYRSVTPSSAEV